MSSVSAASRPAARIPSKSSGRWMVIRLASPPPSMILALPSVGKRQHAHPGGATQDRSFAKPMRPVVRAAAIH